jgi:Tol biopolymer transport system component
MTPREKSIELVDKFMEYTVEWNNVTAKKCAIIAVDEIFEALDEHHWQNRLIIDYWEEVKHELEKL